MLHQINSDDLAALEEMLPVLMMNSALHHQSADRMKWRRVREIVANVRWNYGPPEQCGAIPCDDPHSGQEN